MRRLLMLSLLCVSLACVSLAAGGCGGSSTSTSSSTPSNLVINASPARADVDGGNFITIDAYATVTGTALSSALNFTLTGAGTIAVTGPSLFGDYSVMYTAPGSAGVMSTTSLVGTSASITITSKSDTSKTVSIPIALHDSIQFPTAKPPDASVGKPYTYTFAASGGTGMLSYQLADVSALPAGLTLAANGVLAGTPTAVGTYSFTVVAYDQATKVIGFGRSFTMQVS